MADGHFLAIEDSSLKTIEKYPLESTPFRLLLGDGVDLARDARIVGVEGDEDSLVNFWLYGTTFTALPRATEQQMASFQTRAMAEDLLLRRLDDLVAGLASPGANERLQFARQLVERQAIDPTTAAGQEQARIYLVKARERVIATTWPDVRTMVAALGPEAEHGLASIEDLEVTAGDLLQRRRQRLD